ncbi:MAG: DUF4430 domain-containing protein [Oscillospiraceae bacterium]|nr:DUF4430 domain-containing protein [Oscillospiraceae bacterium]
MKTKKSDIKIIITIVGIIIIAVLLILLWKNSQETATEGVKTITFEVVKAEGDSKEYTFKTETKYLSEALLEQKLAEGEEGEGGLFITTVAGVKADAEKKEWWAFYKSGVLLSSFVSDTPIADGDHFEAVLSVY